MNGFGVDLSVGSEGRLASSCPLGGLVSIQRVSLCCSGSRFSIVRGLGFGVKFEKLLSADEILRELGLDFCSSCSERTHSFSVYCAAANFF